MVEPQSSIQEAIPETSGNVVLDEAVLAGELPRFVGSYDILRQSVLPSGSRVLEIDEPGISPWCSILHIRAQLQDGSPGQYFLKARTLFIDGNEIDSSTYC